MIKQPNTSVSSHALTRHKSRVEAKDVRRSCPTFSLYGSSTFVDSYKPKEPTASISEVRLQETCINVRTYLARRNNLDWQGSSDQSLNMAAMYMKSASLERVQHPLDEGAVDSFVRSIISALLTLLVSIPCSILLVILTPFAFLWKVLFHIVSSFSFVVCYRRFKNPASAQDAQFLLQDDEPIVQCIILLDGTVHVSKIREAFYDGLLTVRTNGDALMFPKLTQILCSPKTKPYWQIDKEFSVENHVYSGPNISSDEGLQLYTSKILSKPLNKWRPLWEVVVVNDMQTNRDTTLILRLHQCIGDGMSLLKALCQSLCDNHIAQIPASPHFGGVTYGASLLKTFFIGPLTSLTWLLRSSELNLLVYQRRESKPRTKRVYTKTVKSDAECANGYLDVRSVVAATGGFVVAYDSQVPLCQLLRIKQVTRSCINEVLLASLAGALRTTLQQLGIRNPPDIKTNLAIDLRCHTSTFVPLPLGTKSSFVPFVLPVSVDGAIPRIWKVRENMEEIKASSDAVVSYVVVWWVYKCLPRKWAASVLSRMRSQSSLQYSSLPGPSTPLQLGGYSIKRIFNVSPPRPPLAVSVSAITYADRVHLAIVVKKTLIRSEWMAKTILLEMQNQCEQMGSTLSYRRLPGEHRRPFSPNTQDHACRPMNELQVALAKVQIELQRVTEEYEQVVRGKLQSKSGDFQQHIKQLPSKTVVRSVSTDIDRGRADKCSRMRRSKSMGNNKNPLLDKGEELSNRIRKLKEEFTELLAEIRHRKSINDRRSSVAPSPEEEDDVRKSRKRTLSVASVKSVTSVKSSNSVKSNPSPVGVKTSLNSFVFPRDSIIWNS